MTCAEKAAIIATEQYQLNMHVFRRNHIGYPKKFDAHFSNYKNYDQCIYASWFMGHPVQQVSGGPVRVRIKSLKSLLRQSLNSPRLRNRVRSGDNKAFFQALCRFHLFQQTLVHIHERGRRPGSLVLQRHGRRLFRDRAGQYWPLVPRRRRQIAGVRSTGIRRRTESWPRLWRRRKTRLWLVTEMGSRAEVTMQRRVNRFPSTRGLFIQDVSENVLGRVIFLSLRT